MTDRSVTELLQDWQGGNDSAVDELMPRVYGELRRLAQHQLKSERRGHTMQATDLVNEACLRLLEADVSWQNKAHFIAVAANQMRRLLVDHARSRKRGKRDHGIRVTLDEAIAAEETEIDVLALDEALEALREIDERKARMIELQYFGGSSGREIAEVLGVSEPTVKRGLRFARSWLYDRLSGEL